MGHDTRAALAALLPWAHRYLARHGASKDEADDIAQEAVLAALESLHSFDPHLGSIRAWFFGVLKHRWINYQRRVLMCREVPLSEEHESLVRPSHEDEFLARDTLRFLSRSTPSERWRVLLARATGATGHEAAAQEGICDGTSYDRVRRGRLDLAAAITREDAAAVGPMVRRSRP